MHTNAEIPQVQLDTSLPEALVVMTEKSLGLTTIVDDDGQLVGIFTDGDLRRAVDHGRDINRALMREVMSGNPHIIHRNLLAAEALGLMEEKKITALVVADGKQPIGIIKMPDILRAGVI